MRSPRAATEPPFYAPANLLFVATFEKNSDFSRSLVLSAFNSHPRQKAFFLPGFPHRVSFCPAGTRSYILHICRYPPAPLNTIRMLQSLAPQAEQHQQNLAGFSSRWRKLPCAPRVAQSSGTVPMLAWVILPQSEPESLCESRTRSGAGQAGSTCWWVQVMECAIASGGNILHRGSDKDCLWICEFLWRQFRVITG